MSRTTTDYPITTRTARAALATGTNARTGTTNKPYWRTITGPIAIGWQASTDAATAGRWYARKSFGAGQYSTQLIGTADDIAPADGGQVLSFEQASIAALAKFNADKAAAPGDITVTQAVEAYLADSKSNHVEGMRRAAQRGIYNSTQLDKGRARVRDLTRAQLESWKRDVVMGLQSRKRAQLAKSGRTEPQAEIVRKSQDSANKTLSLLNAALNHAFESKANGLTNPTEWRLALVKFGKVSAPRTHHFTQAEAQRLIDASPNKAFADLATAAFLIGARYGELRALIVADFNATTGLLRIRNGATKQEARFVPLSDDTVKFFAAACRDKLPAAPIFTQANGKPWGNWHQQRPMKAALKAAGLDQSATLYALRHSHISRALEAGMPIAMIAENCGTSVRMIEQNYAHIFASKKREAANLLGLRIAAKPAVLAVAA